MDEEEDNCITQVAEAFEKSFIKGNASSDRTVIDPEQLIGPQVIDMILKKPEFSFLIRYYSLLYQSLIPNCKATINTLRQHISISDNIEQYIVGAPSHRISCQRLINFLLSHLYSERDYMQFCYFLNIICVMSDLCDRLIEEFYANGNWQCKIPKPHRCVSKDGQHVISVVDASQRVFALSGISQLDVSSCVCNEEALSDHAMNCCIDIYYHRGRMFISEKFMSTMPAFDDKVTYEQNSKKLAAASQITDAWNLSFLLHDSGWKAIEEHINLLCNAVPDNYQLMLARLETMQCFSTKELNQLNKLMSSSTDVRIINEKIVAYLVVKLCYDNNKHLAKKHVMEEHSQSSESAGCLKQEVQNGAQLLRTRYDDILQLLPIDYMKTIQAIQDHLTDKQICHILTNSSYVSANKALIDCLIENFRSSSILYLCDQLEKILPLSVDPVAFFVIINEIRDAEHKLPQNILTNKDLVQLKPYYHTMIHLMPENYQLTAEKLQKYLNDDEIYAILSASNSSVANKMILDSLIARIRCKEELFGLCDQLDSISSLNEMNILLKDIRSGVQKSIQFPVSVTTTYNVLPSSMSTGIGSISSMTVHITSVTSSLNSISTMKSSQGGTKSKMQDNVIYKEKRLQKGLKYMRPPPLPSNHVNRQMLLDEIVTKLLQATNDPNKYETTLTITGAGGFGKTNTTISLCYHPLVKEHFTDGFVFIELGPQAPDPNIKLNLIHNSLTDTHCNINVVENEIQRLTKDLYCNLLVIIDDVWHVEDAKPLVKAFSNCKTIVTTRMNDIEQYIPSKHSVVVGPMEQDEALSLLISGVIDSSQLSHDDIHLLDELAQNVYLWPLLLSLIRGLLYHNLNQYHLSHHKAIQNVQAKLRYQGLTAFDKNYIEVVNKGRKLAVKACIETTLDLLTKSLSDKIKSLILSTGIGISVPKAVLNNLWNISKQEADDTIDILWAYGLVQYTEIIIFNNSTQQCVEVHAVISQYIIECMDSSEVITLLPFNRKLNTARSVHGELTVTFLQLYGVEDPSSLKAMDYLKCMQSQVENVHLPFYLRAINMFTITDPHVSIAILQNIRDILMTSPYTKKLLSLLEEEINSLTNDCRHILKNAHKVCRKFNQSVQRSIYEKNYDKLIQTVEEFIKVYPLYNVILKAVSMVKKIIPYCDGELMHYMMIRYENLQIMTPDYHNIVTIIQPMIKLFIKVHRKISISLLNGSPDIELTHRYLMSGIYEDHELVLTNYLIKIQEVAPNYVYKLAL